MLSRLQRASAASKFGSGKHGSSKLVFDPVEKERFVDLARRWTLPNCSIHSDGREGWPNAVGGASVGSGLALFAADLGGGMRGVASPLYPHASQTSKYPLLSVDVPSAPGAGHANTTEVVLSTETNWLANASPDRLREQSIAVKQSLGCPHGQVRRCFVCTKV
jgi:hypothetical protein